MRIDTFMLAEAASAHRGQLYIHGGGITHLRARSLPHEQPIAVVLRVQIEEGDVLPDEFVVQAFMPDGAPDTMPITVPIPPDRRPKARFEGEEVFLQVVISPGSYWFDCAGIYRFEVRTGDGEVLRSINLPVIDEGEDELNVAQA